MRVHGFTLIEVLVVMLILGVMASTLTLSLRPDTHRQVEDEAYRFARVLEQAVDASEMGDPLALEWRSDGVAFLRPAADGRWQAVRDELFAPRRWPDGIHGEVVRASSDTTPWLLWQENQSPRLYLSLRAGERRMDVNLSPLGRVVVSEGTP